MNKEEMDQVRKETNEAIDLLVDMMGNCATGNTVIVVAFAAFNIFEGAANQLVERPSIVQLVDHMRELADKMEATTDEELERRWATAH